MAEEIEQHFSKIDLDIRKRPQGYSRFMDQKVTPDVLSFISDCILQHTNEDKNRGFTISEIFKSPYFVQVVTEIFGKPSPLDKTTKAEYDKFAGQPIKMLAFSKVLSETENNKANTYKINDLGVLKYIALREFNAFRFIYAYLTKVLTDSGFIERLKKYKEKYEQGSLTKEDFGELKDKFLKFIRSYTNIKKDYEPKRIFIKILNPFAAENRIPGTVAGRMSKFPFTYSDLIYNRINFRDTKKSKNESRLNANFVNPKGNTSEYRIAKAKKIIAERYNKSSEVKDQWSRGVATHVHHIFPKGEFAELADLTENLILLTPEQHFSKAHPNSHTDKIDRAYQLVCLLAKLDNIESSINSNESIYSKDQLINVINTGLKTNLPPETPFGEIREIIKKAY